MTHKDIPIACSLPLAELSNRTTELRTLIDQAQSTERVDRGVVMTFNPELAVSVADLAAKEAACCAFLSMVVDAGDEGVRLEVTTDNEDAIPALEAMLGLAPLV